MVKQDNAALALMGRQLDTVRSKNRLDVARHSETEQVVHSRDLDEQARNSNVARERMGKDTADNRPPFLCNTVALTGDILMKACPSV